MARIRTIKPEFPQSESMGRVSRDARLLFIMLWTIVDDSGRTRAASRMLASLLYPYDSDAGTLIEGWLTELVAERCIYRYVVNGQSYLEICNWLDHQKIDKPSKSKFPSFDESSRILANPRERSSGDQGPRTEGPEDQGRDHANVLDPSLDQQIQDIMATDQATAAKVASEPMKTSWLDWRASHALVGIARTGEDGDGEAWRHLWNTYGAECFDPMYADLVKRLQAGKKIWYSMAAEWLNKNTKEVA